MTDKIILQAMTKNLSNVNIYLWLTRMIGGNKKNLRNSVHVQKMQTYGFCLYLNNNKKRKSANEKSWLWNNKLSLDNVARSREGWKACLKGMS